MIFKPLLAAASNILFPGISFLQAGKKNKFRLLFIIYIGTFFGIRLLSFNLWILAFFALVAVSLFLWLLVDSFITALNYDPKRKNRVKPYVYLLLLAFQFSIAFYIQSPYKTSLSLVELFTIPAPNMLPTLKVGDHIAVKRTKEIDRSDIIIFKFPKDLSTHYVKRCVALPGDTFSIVNGLVYIDKEMSKKEYQVNHAYIVETDEILQERVFHRIGIDDYFSISDYTFYNSSSNSGYRINSTDKQAEDIAKLAFIKQVKKVTHSKGEGNPHIFPNEFSDTWNADNYGPLYVPAKGDKISITPKTLSIYKDIILEHEGIKDVKIVYDKLYISGEEVKEYTFNQNYYFGLGDNRSNSLDSRYWGFIPENLIFGKAIYRYWSKDKTRLGKI